MKTFEDLTPAEVSKYIDAAIDTFGADVPSDRMIEARAREILADDQCAAGDNIPSV